MAEAAAVQKPCSTLSGHLSCVAAMYMVGRCLTPRGRVSMSYDEEKGRKLPILGMKNPTPQL